MVGSFVVHGTLLHGDYGRLSNLFGSESDAQQHFPLMLLAHVILSGAKQILFHGILMLLLGLLVAFLYRNVGTGRRVT